ncbi:MAG: hypothetical protein JW941_06050 [Candidatus Coatesbacteria bacterium]|nr:hypothetical protein [Candidatus Coatesbacteria bacterium]
MRAIASAVVLLLVVLAATGLEAETYHVRQDGTGDFASIQAAIDASLDGDEIVVHPGTFYENIHFDGKNIVLRCTDPEDKDVVASTIIDGASSDSVVRFSGVESGTCRLMGFTITKGRSYYGGGIDGGEYQLPHTHASIENCVITSNEGMEGGGVAFCDGEIVNCEITNNRYGGMGCWEGGGLFLCNGNITGCYIAGHSAYGGAGLYGCIGRISDCVITDNSSDYGAGVCGGVHGLFNCLIFGNTSAGVRNYQGPIGNCTFFRNSVAAIDICDSNVTNCVIWGNNFSGDDQLLDTVPPSHCCIQNWTGSGEGNISDDPLLVSGPLGGYYLDPNSPCVNTGSVSADEAGLSDRTTQADGTPDTGVVDMGYHYRLPEQNTHVEVICALNSEEFAPGDVIQGFMGIENRGDDIEVDVYAVIVRPNGFLLSLTNDGFADGAWPCFSDLVLPSGFAAWPETMFELTIPAGIEQGSYSYFAAACRPGEGPSGVISIDEWQFEIRAAAI